MLKSEVSLEEGKILSAALLSLNAQQILNLNEWIDSFIQKEPSETQKIKNREVHIKDLELENLELLIYDSKQARSNSITVKQITLERLDWESKTNELKLLAKLKNSKMDPKNSFELISLSLLSNADGIRGDIKVDNYESKSWIHKLINSFPIPTKEEPELTTSQITSSFYVEGDRIYTPDLIVKTALLNAKGHGYLDFEQNLHYDINVQGLSEILPLEQFKLNYIIPGTNIIKVKIFGNISEPKILPILTPLPEAPKTLKNKFLWFKNKL